MCVCVSRIHYKINLLKWQMSNVSKGFHIASTIDPGIVHSTYPVCIRLWFAVVGMSLLITQHLCQAIQIIQQWYQITNGAATQDRNCYPDKHLAWRSWRIGTGICKCDVMWNEKCNANAQRTTLSKRNETDASESRGASRIPNPF